MLSLIPALCAAHAALLNETGDDEHLASTARKIELALVGRLKLLSASEQSKHCTAVMNSGSLKALKLIPEEARPPRHPSYGSEGPNPEFILKQPASYLREALKRGLTINDRLRLQLFESIAATPDIEGRKQMEDIILLTPSPVYGDSSAFFAATIIKTMMSMANGADQIADLAERILKRCYKASKQSIDRDFADMLGIFHPGAASEKLYHAMVAYALLGAERPDKEHFEHDDMARLANSIASPAGRRELKEATGGLASWLAGGHRSPPAIITEFERKRQGWRLPSDSRW